MRDKLQEHQALLERLVQKISAGNLFNLNVEERLKKHQLEGQVWLLGAGKASVEMARQAEILLGESIKDGMIIAPESAQKLDRVQVFTGSHPYPDEDSVSSSYELWQLAKKIPKEDTVIFCLSGGASALFCIPVNGVEMDEYRDTFELLLKSGASIHEINVVRKHISETAGGKLGELFSGHRLISLILSDVPGDDPDVVGSGPTVPDTSTFKEAFHVLKKYGLWEKIPHSVRIHISKGLHGDVTENPQQEDVQWEFHSVEMISGAQILAENVGQFLSSEGKNVQVARESYDMDVQKIMKKICGDAISILGKKGDLSSPAALIYFGESTVSVKEGGKGGRNQHLALSAAISIEGQHPISLLSLATDGVDGPTDAAGAIINSQTTLSARKKKLEPETYLKAFDSYQFHQQMDAHIKTGPTGNNLMDLQVALIG